MMDPSKTVLVAGGSGFIGRNFREQPSFFPNHVNLDREPGADYVCNLQETWPAVQNVGAVVVMASEPNIWGQEHKDVEHEVRILREAMRFCRRFGVKRLIHLSSSNVYNIEGLHPPFKEIMRMPYSDRYTGTRHPYGTQKLLAEQYLFREAFKREGIVSMSVRLFNVIGKYQRKTMFPYLIAKSMILANPIYKRTTMYRSWTPVDEVCLFLNVLLGDQNLTEGHHTFNYGAQKVWTQQGLIDLFMMRMIALKIKVNPDIQPSSTEHKGEMHYTQPNMDAVVKRYGAFVLPRDHVAFAVDDVIKTVISDLQSTPLPLEDTMSIT